MVGAVEGLVQVSNYLKGLDFMEEPDYNQLGTWLSSIPSQLPASLSSRAPPSQPAAPSTAQMLPGGSTQWDYHQMSHSAAATAWPPLPPEQPPQYEYMGYYVPYPVSPQILRTDVFINMVLEP